VWAQCPDTGLWARGHIERLSEQRFLKGTGGLYHAVAWEKPCRRSCAACVGTSEVSIWCLQPRVGTEEPKLLPAQGPAADPKEREWRLWSQDFIRHLPPRTAVEPRSLTPPLEAGVDGAGAAVEPRSLTPPLEAGVDGAGSTALGGAAGAAVEPRSLTPPLEAGVDGAGSAALGGTVGAPGAAGGAPARVAACGGQEGDAAGAAGGAPARVAECGGQQGDAASDSELEIVEELCTVSAVTVIDMTEDAD
jgi:hypothetical protein